MTFLERFFQDVSCRRLGLAVFLVSALLFSPSVFFEFIDFDDPDYVLQNEHVRNGLGMDGIFWAFRSCGYAHNWHPLTWISLMGDVSAARLLVNPLATSDGDRCKNLDCATRRHLEEAKICVPDNFVFNSELAGWTGHRGVVSQVMHLHNVILHAVATTLLFLLMVISCGRAEGEYRSSDALLCTLLALLWSVHPLRCEVVCWVSERKELLAVCFMLATLIFHARAIESDRKARHYMLLSLVCCACALLSKPVAVSLPIVMLAWDAVLARRQRWGVISMATVMTAICCVFTMLAQQGAMADRDVTVVAANVSMALKAPFVYLRQTILPYDLASFYALEFAVDWKWILPGVALISVFAYICLRWWRRGEVSIGFAMLGIVWCYVGLIPTLGLVKVGDQPHSDRYTYWVGTGLVLVVALLCSKFGRLVSEEIRRNTTYLLVSAVIVYGGVSIFHMQSWHDTLRFYSENVLSMRKYEFPKVKNDMAAVRFLGLHMNNLGYSAEADRMVREAASENICAESIAQMALFLVQSDSRKNADEAKYMIGRAIELDSKNITARIAAGCLARKENRPADAIAALGKAYDLGYRTGRLKKEMEELKHETASLNARRKE